MGVLVSHCGRYGDLLWSLPATRAIAETVGEPVDFCISEAYGSRAVLVGRQEYIKEAWGEPGWKIRETAPITPTEPPTSKDEYDLTIHLSMKGWPLSNTLAEG